MVLTTRRQPGKGQLSELWMLLLVLLALTLRTVLIAENWPATNSDEATMGLMALHIAFKGEHPIYFYGQGYMGTIQAYLGALLFHLFGPSLFSLRLGLVLLFGLYLISLYCLARTLYTQRFALFVVALLSGGSTGLVSGQVFANGGYGEIMSFGALIFLLTTHLVLTAAPSARSVRAERVSKRGALYLVLGLLVGLAIWTHLTIVPWVLSCALLLWLFCRSEIGRGTALCLLGGLLVGLLPMILYNLCAPPGMDSLHAFTGSTGYTGSRQGVSFLQQLLQALLISLPNATGANPTCWMPEPLHHITTLQELFLASEHAQQCVLIHGSWALGAVLLWILALVLTLIPLWRQRQLLLARQEHASLERHQLMLQFIRAMLLLSAALTFCLYALSTPAALHPRTTARYLSLIMLAMPAVLWPLWNGWEIAHSCLRHVKKGVGWLPGSLLVFRGALLTLIVWAFVQGMLGVWHEIPLSQHEFAQQEQLSQHLVKLGVTRIYSDYWTCASLTFQSQEKVICASLDEQLAPGQDRYMPYRVLVRSAPYPAYVFAVKTPQAHILEERKAHLDPHYQGSFFEGYVIYALPK